jgi:hypothetical protein
MMATSTTVRTSSWTLAQAAMDAESRRTRERSGVPIQTTCDVDAQTSIGGFTGEHPPSSLRFALGLLTFPVAGAG